MRRQRPVPRPGASDSRRRRAHARAGPRSQLRPTNSRRSVAAGALMLGLGQGEPASDVGRDRRGFRGGAASGGEQLPRAVCWWRTASASRRARASAASSACARSPLAQSWTRICAASRWRARARPGGWPRRRQSSGAPRGRGPPGRRRRGPEHAVLTHGRTRGLEVRSRSVELAAADLDVGADDEQPVREARVDAAERGGAEPVSLVPVADRQQRLDLVRDEQSTLDPYRRIASSPDRPSRADSWCRPSMVSASVQLTYARSRPIRSPISSASCRA